MMGFQFAWATLSGGETVRVSNEQPEPGNGPDSFDHRAWRSHNFVGTLVEKVDGFTRYLRFELPQTPEGAIIGYLVSEDVPHSFEVLA